MMYIIFLAMVSVTFAMPPACNPIEECPASAPMACELDAAQMQLPCPPAPICVVAMADCPN